MHSYRFRTRRHCAFGCCVRHWIVLILLLAACSAQAQVVVPAGGSWSLGNGKLEMAETGLQVGGSFGIANGRVDAISNVDIVASGLIDAGNGTLTLFGNWNNQGGFSGGTSHVDFVDGAINPSNITGNTGFANASFVTNNGKSYAFAAGSTQSIGATLQIQGNSAAGIQFKSQTAGQVAYLNLLAVGIQDIAFVGVSNVHATGQWLAPNLTNDGGTGDADRWFCGYLVACGIPPSNVPVAAPTLSLWALLLLALGAGGIAIHFNLRRSHSYLERLP